MSAQVRFYCPACKATMEAPVDRAGSIIHCLKCGQRMQVPPAERAKTVLPSALDIDGVATSTNRSDGPRPQTGVRVGSPPLVPEELDQLGPFNKHLFGHWPLPVLTAACYAGIWVAFIVGCIAILMPTGLAIICSILSAGTAAVTLSLSVRTFVTAAKLWNTQQSGTAVAGLVCSTITAIYCTAQLMCGCVWVAVMLKGIDMLSNLAGGHQRF